MTMTLEDIDRIQQDNKILFAAVELAELAIDQALTQGNYLQAAKYCTQAQLLFTYLHKEE